MRNLLLSALSLTCLCVAPLAAPSQTKAPSGPPGASTAPAQADPDYSAESVVIEHLDSVYTMAADGTGSKQTSIVARVQTEAAVRQLGVLNIPYAASSEHVEILYARARHPDGTVTDTPVTGAIDMPSPVTQQAPFYSDLKQMQLPIRNLRVGDKLEWQAKDIKTTSEAAGEFWGQENFSEDAVVLSQTLELRVPKDKYVNVWSPKNKPVETVAGNERIFRWTGSQTKPTAGKQADAARELAKKQLWTEEQEIDAAQGKLATVQWTTFKSWEAVGAWYRQLEAGRMLPDAEVKAKVAEITAGKITEEQKVQAVYSYVATQIRYIGVAFGIGRYQPHRASEVLRNQYGDCKDKHTLLAAMLSAIGLHPEAALIGAGVRFNQAVPSPNGFNHVITRVDVAGQPIWLDSTTEVAPYRMLSYIIRDRQSLVVPENGVAAIERTPAKPPFPAFQKLDAVGTLDKEGTSTSRLIMTLRGDDELAVRSALRQYSPAQYDQFVQQLSQGIGYSGTTSNAEVGRPEDTAEPFKMAYDYKREKAGDWDNLKIVPQVAPVSLPRPDEKNPPVQAISLGVPRVESSTSAMKLPEGWGAVLPEAVHAKSAYATYDETYRSEKGTVFAERKIEVLQDKVPIADWKSYKKWADTVDLGNEQYIQLVRHDNVHSADDAATELKASDAATLVASAYSAIQRHDMDSARPLLDKAKSINPEQEWLWTSYGFLDLQRGEMTVASEDFRKELSLHPERYETYAALAQLQSAQGKHAEARETLERWSVAEPGNPLPALQVATLQMADNDPAAAVKTLEATIAGLPEEKKKNPMLQMTLGTAQMKAGMKNQARVTLAAVLETTDDPALMNNSAYELADAGQELPLAETKTRAALETMAAATATWTLDESPAVLIGKSQMFFATWDTMGWILFREGKLDEAESYLKAAWMNQPSATVGEHVAQTAAAKSDKNAALTYYELAAATISSYDNMGVKKAPGAREKELAERADTLRKAGAKSSTHDTHQALQDLRKFPLGPAHGLDGTAEYRLLLGAGTVQRAEKTGTKELPGGAEMLKKAKLAPLWPAGPQASFVRTGMLNCHSGICELYFEQ